MTHHDPNPHRWLFGPGLGPAKKPEPPKRAHYDPPMFIACPDCGARYHAHRERCFECGAPKPSNPVGSGLSAASLTLPGASASGAFRKVER